MGRPSQYSVGEDGEVRGDGARGTSGTGISDLDRK